MVLAAHWICRCWDLFRISKFCCVCSARNVLLPFKIASWLMSYTRSTMVLNIVLLHTDNSINIELTTNFSAISRELWSLRNGESSRWKWQKKTSMIYGNNGSLFFFHRINQTNSAITLNIWPPRSRKNAVTSWSVWCGFNNYKNRSWMNEWSLSQQ